MIMEALMSATAAKAAEAPVVDVTELDVEALPRRSDETYMRGLRRRRA